MYYMAELNKYLFGNPIMRQIHFLYNSMIGENRKNLIYKQSDEQVTTAQQEAVLKRKFLFMINFFPRWTEAGIDALLCPISPHCAFKSENICYFL